MEQIEQSDFIDEMNRHYRGARAVAIMIDRLDTTDEDFLPGGIRSRREWIDAIYRNCTHLEIILEYKWPETYDLQPFRDAIVKAKAKLEAMRMEAKP